MAKGRKKRRTGLLDFDDDDESVSSSTPSHLHGEDMLWQMGADGAVDTQLLAALDAHPPNVSSHSAHSPTSPLVPPPASVEDDFHDLLSFVTSFNEPDDSAGVDDFADMTFADDLLVDMDQPPVFLYDTSQLPDDEDVPVDVSPPPEPPEVTEHDLEEEDKFGDEDEDEDEGDIDMDEVTGKRKRYASSVSACRPDAM